MATTRLALKALKDQIQIALANAKTIGTISSPGQVFIGWPTSTKLSDLFAQPTKQALVSVWAMKGKSTSRFRPIAFSVTQPTPGTTATLNAAKTVLTIGGTPTAGDVVHAFFAHPQLDAAVLVATGDNANSIATKVAAAANAYGITGITANASGANVTLTGATFSVVNVGGTSQMMREVGRIEKLVQVSVWCNDPDDRLYIADVITTNVGGRDAPFLTASDGTAVRCQIIDDMMNDNAQSSYTSFRQDIHFLLEYGLTQIISATQVEGVQFTDTLNNNPSPVTQYFSGGS